MLQSEEFVPDELMHLIYSFAPFNRINLIANSYEKELISTDPKKLNSHLLVHTGYNNY